jgi:hypothetical protein
MNDSMSMLLATSILALGGLGLYMFKTSDDKHYESYEEYDEDATFGSGEATFGSGEASFDLGRLFNWGASDEKAEDDDKEDKVEDLYEEDYKPRKRGPKTLKNRKTTGSSRRRYY